MSPNTWSQSDHIEIRKKKLSQEDWENHKSNIGELYLTPGMTLKKVRDKMIELYQFEATPKMYKDHLAKWDIRKNSPRAPTNASTPSSSMNDNTQADDPSFNASSSSGSS